MTICQFLQYGNVFELQKIVNIKNKSNEQKKETL